MDRGSDDSGMVPGANGVGHGGVTGRFGTPRTNASSGTSASSSACGEDAVGSSWEGSRSTGLVRGASGKDSRGTMMITLMVMIMRAVGNAELDLASHGQSHHGDGELAVHCLLLLNPFLFL